MKTVKDLQKEIIRALEVGDDPAPIEKELADLRARIAAEAEQEMLQKIANARQRLKI